MSEITPRKLELARKWLIKGHTLALICRWAHVTPQELDLALWRNLGRKP